jgi:hypothetical protein
MTDNPRWSYCQCPGVPGLVSECTKRLRSRALCEDCERTAKAGKVVGNRQCLGISAIGHVCIARVRGVSKRCRACLALYQKYLDDIVGLKKSRVDRRCLCCDKAFVTYNKFIRLCKGCKRINSSAEYAGLSDEHYSIRVKPLRNGGRS